MSDLAGNLRERFTRRERRALAEVISLVELGAAPGRPEASDAGNETLVVGITGSAGSGKSTLVGALMGHLRARGISVAVLACDPSSPLTGGALLGDRVRVRFDPDDEQVFFRSLSTRGAPGGISAATGPAVEWLRAFGFDVVLVETVGVGQDQVAVRAVVDKLVLVVAPNTGDEVQWEKAGLLEVADLVVVNKGDLAGADRARSELAAALSLGPRAGEVPVLLVTAATGHGVAEMWDAIGGR